MFITLTGIDDLTATSVHESRLAQADRPGSTSKLRGAERDGTLPKEKASPGLPISEIIRHCDRAVPPSTDDVSFIERYANSGIALDLARDAG